MRDDIIDTLHREHITVPQCTDAPLTLLSVLPADTRRHTPSSTEINSPKMRDSCCATSTYMDMRYVGGFPTKTPPKSLLGCTPVDHLPPPKYCCTPVPSAAPQVLLYSPVPSASCSSKAIMAKHRQAHTSPHALGIVTPARMHSVSSHPVTLDLWASSREFTSQPRDESSPVPVESSPPSLETKVGRLATARAHA